ncbi:MAG: hypothetical protein C0418_02360 [Coriobacteriaceae bacterium]|nr:hypothetical protein [Coriobacteriaceae bacterium]
MSPAQTSVPTGSPVRTAALPERRVAVVLGTLALVALVVAVALNVLLGDVVRPGAGALAGDGALIGTGTVSFDVPTPPVEMLPANVIGYETITRQGVPGEQEVAAEAMYVTLSMETEIQVPIGSYARAQAFPSALEAQAEVDRVMAGFPLRAEDLVLNGVTPAVAGYAPDEGAWTVAWTRGTYAIYVKTLFRDKIPAQKKDFLRRIGTTVVEAVDTYQRTGKQGLQF